jgi:hypothetical protein
MALFSSSTRQVPDTAPCRGTLPSSWMATVAGLKSAFLPRVAGHVKGVELVREMVRACLERGIQYLTLFAFSSENWRRPQEEVSLLMQLFVKALEQEVEKLDRNGVRLRMVGDLSRFEPRLQELIRKARPKPRAIPARSDHRRQLWWTLGHHAGDQSHAGRPAGKARGLAGGRSGTASVDEFRAGARSVHPHRRRGADQQFPALAAGLYRTVFHPTLVAGISIRPNSTRRSPPSSNASGVLGGPANNWWKRSMLKTRVITALVLMALVLPSLFYSAATLMGAAGGRFHRHRRLGVGRLAGLEATGRVACSAWRRRCFVPRCRCLRRWRHRRRRCFGPANPWVVFGLRSFGCLLVPGDAALAEAQMVVRRALAASRRRCSAVANLAGHGAVARPGPGACSASSPWSGWPISPPIFPARPSASTSWHRRSARARPGKGRSAPASAS